MAQRLVERVANYAVGLIAPYEKSKKRPLWTGNYIFPSDQKDAVKQTVTQCAIDDMEGKFRFSGYIVDLGNGMSRYTFTNNSRPTNPQPPIDQCQRAYHTLRDRFEGAGIIVVDATPTIGSTPEMIDSHTTRRIPYGLRTGYEEGAREQTVDDLRRKLGEGYPIFEGEIFAVGGTGGNGQPATHENTKLYTEPIGLVLAHRGQVGKVYRQAFKDEQQILIEEMPLAGKVRTDKRRQIQIGRKV